MGMGNNDCYLFNGLEEIIMPQDKEIEEKMKRKRVEYIERINNFKEEEERITYYYRIILLDLLFENRRVNKDEYFIAVGETIKPEFRSSELFYNAWDIIKDYL